MYQKWHPLGPDFYTPVVDLPPCNSVPRGGNVKISRSICSDEENLKKSIKWYKLIYFLSVISYCQYPSIFLILLHRAGLMCASSTH